MRAHVLSLLLLGAVTGSASGQERSFDPWLNDRIHDLVAARIEMSDPAKRADAVAGAGPQSPIVDRAAVPDVVGFSVRLPAATGAGKAQPTTAAFSGNPLAAVVGLLESRTLDPSFYVDNPGLRRLGLSVSFDQDAESRTRTLFQAKYLIRDRGNVLANNQQVGDALIASSDAYGRLARAVRDILWQRVGQGRFAATVQGRVDFANTLTDAAVMQNTLNAAGSAGLAEIDAAIEKEIESFVALRSVIEQAATSARRRPLLAIGVTGELTENSARQVRAAGIWDVTRGAADFTVNLGWNYVEATADLPEVNRAELAGQLVLRISQENAFSGTSALSVSVGGSAGVDLDGSGNLSYKLQARVSVPLATGVNVPLSATWSNRRDLINEDEVRGNVGFSFDLAQLMTAAR